jgi:hypothetical protein
MALTEQEVAAIVAKYAVKLKDWKSRNDNDRYNQVTKERLASVTYPEYWEGYNYAARQFDAMSPHIRGDVYPAHLFAVRAPNETKQQSDYIRANYKPITLPVFEDFKATISRAFADQNWSVQYKGEKDERFGSDTFEDYINNQISIFGSLELFVKAMLPTLKLSDPNGILAIFPDKVMTSTNEEGVEVATNDLVNPEPHYYSCKRIVAQDTEKYTMVVSQYYSQVKEGNKIENQGQVLFLFDDTYVWRIEQGGKKSDYKFSEPFIHYTHNLGYVPVIKLMGTPMLIGDSVVFNSPFLTSVPLLDQVVLDNSYLGMVKATSAFPFMVSLGESCEFMDNEGNKCSDGHIMDTINGGSRTCPSCNGAGIRSRFSPSGVLLIRPKSNFSEGDTGLNGEYVKFVSPPMDTLKFLREEIDTHIIKSRSVLHINNSDQAIQGNEANTATGSMNKMRSMYAFLKPISDQMFAIWEFTMSTIGAMRYGEFFGGVTLVYPTTFDVTTPSDYLSIITEGINAGVPPSVTFANVYNYVKAINYTDEQSNAMYELIMAADELFLMSSADIALRIANGTVEKWQDVLHSSAPQLIMELIRNFVPTQDAEQFFELSLEEQIVALRDLAVSKVVEVRDPIAAAAQSLVNGFS